MMRKMRMMKMVMMQRVFAWNDGRWVNVSRMIERKQRGVSGGG